MRFVLTSWVLISCALLLSAPGCSGRTGDGATDEEPTVLEQGSTEQSPDYFVTDTGEIVYRDSRERVQGSTPSGAENPSFPPLFPGSQRIYPAKEDPALRKSYVTRAPYEAVEQFYTNYLAYGDETAGKREEEPTVVNTVNMTDEGRRSTTLFVNEDDGPRGGMKVMIKDFPAQRAVQIVLTTLSATPPGLDPFGIYVTPEELEEWEKRAAEEAKEREERRKELEEQATGAESESGDEESTEEEAD